MLVALSRCEIARADSLRLPLEGFYHPGRAMPVMWDRAQNSPGDGMIELAADGAISTRVNAAGSFHGVFPWLVALGETRDVRWRFSAARGNDLGAALHPVESNERLVGMALDDDLLADDLFSSKRKIRVHLDAAGPIEGPGMAWESLDALVVSPAQLSKMSSSARRDLLAAGVMLAVTGDAPPDDQLPWKRSGRLWVMSCELPSLPMIEPQAYSPTLGWVGGKSWSMRRRTLLATAIFCIASWGVSLWRGRRMPLALAGLCAVTMICAAWADARQSRFSEGFGDVHLVGIPMGVVDQWHFLRASSDADFLVAAHGLITPLFYDSHSMQEAELTLNCDADGQPTLITGHLKAGSEFAIATRQIDIEQLQKPQKPITSPLRALDVRSLYPGLIAIGQLEETGADASGDKTRWPAVVFERTAQPNVP